MHPSRVVFWWQSAGRKWMFGKTFPYEMNWELDWLNPSLKKHTHTHTLANRKLHELWARFRIDSHWYNFARLWTKKIEDMNQERLGLFSRLPSTPVMSGKMCQRRTGYELGGLLSLLVYGAEVFWILQKVSYTWHLCIIFNIIYTYHYHSPSCLEKLKNRSQHCNMSRRFDFLSANFMVCYWTQVWYSLSPCRGLGGW